MSLHLLLGSKSWGCHQGSPCVQGQVLIHWETIFPNSCLVEKEIPRLDDESAQEEPPTHLNSLHHRGKESQRQSLLQARPFPEAQLHRRSIYSFIYPETAFLSNPVSVKGLFKRRAENWDQPENHNKPEAISLKVGLKGT